MHRKNSTKFLLLIIYIVLAQSLIFAISPTSEVNSIGQSSYVGKGIFPVRSSITFDVYDFNFIEDYPTTMKFNINGGYSTRSIIQDPITGLVKWCDNFKDNPDAGTYLDNDDYDSYGIIYSGWEMKFSQLLPISEKLPGKLTTWISTAGHYEQAIDLLQIYQDPDPYQNDTIFNQLFLDANKTFVGNPDLSGDHYSENFSLRLGFIYTQKIFNKISLNLNLNNYYSPYWFYNNNSDDNSNFSYYKFKPTLSLSKTIYNIKYNDLFNGSKFRLFSIKWSNTTSYRYITGESIPKYMVDYDNNLRHAIQNNLSLYLYGPQIIAKDTYPYIRLYYYADYKWGELNNCNYDEYNSGEFSHSLRATIEFRLIGIIHFQYKLKLDLDGFNLSHYPNFYVQL